MATLLSSPLSQTLTPSIQWTWNDGLATHFEITPGQWQTDGLWEVVKTNDQRTIARVMLATGTVYWKECRANRPRAWLREWVRPPKAKMEFTKAKLLAARGVNVPEVLAWGRVPTLLPSTSFLLTKALPQAIPLVELLESALSTQQRWQLTQALAVFFAQIHNAGVRHPDPHPGNILAQPGFRFTLLDLHAVQVGKTLTPEQTITEMVPLNRWFQARCTRTERLRFWKTYCEARQWTNKTQTDLLAKRLEEETEASNRSFWQRRCKRYTRNNREYKAIRGHNSKGYSVTSLDSAFIQNVLKNPYGYFSHNTIKNSRTSSVVEIATPVGPAILKRFNLKSATLLAKNALRQPPALRSWLLGHNLRDRWLPTPQPLIVFWKLKYKLPAECYLLVEKVTNAREVPDYLQGLDLKTKWAWLLALGRMLRQMHDKGVRHRDLKTSNILVTADGTPTFIDLVGVTVGGEISMALRVKNLARLATSLMAQGICTRTDLLRLLRGYLAPLPLRREAWQEWWQALTVAVQVKQAKNQRTGRALS